MKKIITALAIATAALQFTACNPIAKENAAKEENIKDEVMKVHDDAMAKLGEVSTEHLRLTTELDSLKADSAAVEDSTYKAKTDDLKVTIKSLEDAKKGMMNWMNNYTAPAKEADHDQLMDFYGNELEKVNRVMIDIDASLKDAKEL